MLVNPERKAIDVADAYAAIVGETGGAKVAVTRDSELKRISGWSLDPMTRADAQDAIDTLDVLDAAGVDFVSFREPYVSSLGPWRGAVLGLLATLAKTEKVRLSDMTKAGLVRTRARKTPRTPAADLHRPICRGNRRPARSGPFLGEDGREDGDPADVAP